jgi:hypothetical protein
MTRDAILTKIFLTDEEQAAADLNGDGKLDTTNDVQPITRYLNGQIQTFTGCAFVPRDIPQLCSASKAGDVNGDGKIDNADIGLARRQVLGKHQLDAPALVRADVNGKDGVTTLDVTLIRRYLLGLDSTFPGCSTTSVQPSLRITQLGTTSAMPGERVAVYLFGLPTGNGYTYNVSIIKGGTRVTEVEALPSRDGTYVGFSVPNISTGPYLLNVSARSDIGAVYTSENYANFTITAPTQNNGTATTTPAVVEGKPLVCGSLGDVNGDGRITAADKELAQTFVLGTAAPTDTQKAAADVNKSGGVTSLDLTLIQRYLNGLEATFSGCSTSGAANQFAAPFYSHSWELFSKWISGEN